MRPPASLSNRISYRAVMCVSISRSRPVITTHGSVSNRINSQTPVGGPTQLSGVLWEIISQPLFRHHTHTHTRTGTHTHSLTSARLNPSRLGVCRSDRCANVHWGGRSSVCLGGRVWKRETASSFSSSHAHLCTAARERAHGGELEDQSISLSILAAPPTLLPARWAYLREQFYL